MDGKKFLSVNEKVNLEETLCGSCFCVYPSQKNCINLAAPRSLVDEDEGKIWLNSIGHVVASKNVCPKNCNPPL